MNLNKNEIIELLSKYAKNVEEIDKLISLLDQYCNYKKDSDELYEISGVVKVVRKQLNQLGYDIYCKIHENDNPQNVESLMFKLGYLNQAENN